MLIENNKIYCVHCKEYVSYDGGNWVNCHCFGCRDDEPENFPSQWGVDTNFESRPTPLAPDRAKRAAKSKPSASKRFKSGAAGKA